MNMKRLIVSDLFFAHDDAQNAYAADLEDVAADFLLCLKRLGVDKEAHGFDAESLAKDYIERL
jgi:hypothetical protein